MILVMCDVPNDPEFVKWLHGLHMAAVKATPGAIRVRRHEVLDGPPDRRQCVGVVETEAIDATLAIRIGAANTARMITESCWSNLA